MRVTAVPKGRRGRARRMDGAEGIDFVRCLICGKHLRVISGRHLCTHGIDRETYIEEYRLTPDQLCAKDFRRLHSSRRDYHRYGKRGWIVAVRKLYKREGKFCAGYCKTTIHISIVKVFGCLALGMRCSVQPDSRLRKCGYYTRIFRLPSSNEHPNIRNEVSSVHLML
jgi:hypothetical protein